MLSSRSSPRPAAGEASSTGLAPHEGAQWEVRVRALLRCGARQVPGQDRLHAVEEVLRDQRLEVAALSANVVLGDVHDAGIKLVPQQYADRLRCERTAARLVKPQALECLRSCCLVSARSRTPRMLAAQAARAQDRASGSCPSRAARSGSLTCGFTCYAVLFERFNSLDRTRGEHRTSRAGSSHTTRDACLTLPTVNAGWSTSSSNSLTNVVPLRSRRT
jgi:hypothetical protein